MDATKRRERASSGQTSSPKTETVIPPRSRESTGRSHDRVTLDDLARCLSLSPSTVSRALTGTGRVSAATELRVRQTALNLGYTRPSARPMIGVSTIHGQKSANAPHCVVIIIPSLLDPLSATIAERMQQQIADGGCEPILFSTKGTAAREREAIHTWNSMADGFVLISPQLSDVQIRRLAELKPTVVIGRRMPLSGTSCAAQSVTADEHTAVTAAMKTLWNMGHRSVTYLAGPHLSWTNRHRRQCLWQQAMQHGISYRVIENSSATIESGSEAFTLYDSHRTDAVVAFNDLMAIGFMQAAASANCKVPQDVSVIAFGDTPAALLTSPTLSAIRQPATEMADLAAETILAGIESRGAAQSSPAPLAARFIKRDSVARKPATPRMRRVLVDSMRSLHASPDIDLTLMARTANEIRPALSEFERRFPNIHVRIEQSGPQAATIARLHNRMDANRNVPDLFRVEYDKLPQLALEGRIANLRSPRVEREFSPKFLTRAWASAHYGNGLFAIPADIAPMVMFYRKDIFARYDMPVPRTWHQYHDVGMKLQSLAPETTMGCINTADAQHYLALLRMAGSPLWTMSGSANIQISLTAPRIGKAAILLQRCLDDGVLTMEPETAHGMARRLRCGLLAAPVMPTWFADVIVKSHPDGAGLWSVALPPAFDDPRRLVTSTAGGSALAVSATSPRDRQRAAASTAFWLESDPSAVRLKSLGTIPAARCGLLPEHDAEAVQSSDAASPVCHRRKASDAFFGDALRTVFAEAVQRLDESWQPLPFMTKVDADFHDTVLPALAGGDSANLLKDWQSSIAGHAHSLGFTVRE